MLLEHFWVEAGDLPRMDPESGKYVVTETVKGHLSNLARAVLLRRHPILLQGPTPSGKTSLVEYLSREQGIDLCASTTTNTPICKSISVHT